MIRVVDKSNCCGCGACSLACPGSCISMREDSEGFLYPVPDEDICTGCGLCEAVCNALHPKEKRLPLKVLAAINDDEYIRLKSSSGGIFHFLAKQTIDEGGVVFGARFDENWQVTLDYSEDLAGVEAFMGSKYVQARSGEAYRSVNSFLEKGRKVLFSGTPCQVAGLKQFLGREYDNLLTVDFVCHGVPSPKVWGMYMEEVAGDSGDITGVEFRCKDSGWKNYSLLLKYNASTETLTSHSPFRDDPYMRAFLSDISLRPSCYECKVRGGRSGSDITLADFWGVGKIFPEMDDDKGTGMVFINTLKGEEHFGREKVSCKSTTYERIRQLNPSCERSPKMPHKRALFFAALGKENLTGLILRCTKPTLKKRLQQMPRKCKLLIKRLLGI